MWRLRYKQRGENVVGKTMAQKGILQLQWRGQKTEEVWGARGQGKQDL